MRLIKKKADIDYQETMHFFKNRADKFREDNPYSVTMYQDHNKKLVDERNEWEIRKLKPMLRLDETSRILDVACGIGRWADGILEPVEEYCGIDFSGDLISIAKKRNQRENFFFYESAVTDLEQTLQTHHKGNYNVILLIWILMYINDADLRELFCQLERKSAEHVRICVREPIGLQDRLTLKDFYSEELQDRYHAIYRTMDEIVDFFQDTILKQGFCMEQEGFLFEEAGLNNRKETAQYYFLLTR